MYKRIILKLSGESLKGDEENGISASALAHYASEIHDAYKSGVEIAIVIGGGNFIRGKELSESGLDRSTADYMGMIATVINSLALQNSLEKLHVKTRVMSGIEMHRVCEPYIQRRAIRHLEKGRVVIFAAGTGNPFFSTDTAATLRGLEIHADVFVKGTRVDGVYDKDPEVHSDAIRFTELSFTQALERNLGVIDATAFALCRENKLPIIVFDITKSGNLVKILNGDLSLGTVLKE
jgi:uridylate kinase